MITIPEALPVKLTERVIDELEENSLSVEHLIINNIVKDADCEFHRRRMEMQKKYLEVLMNMYSGKNIQFLYAEPHEIKGIKRITETSRSLFA